MIVPLQVGREKSVSAIDEGAEADRLIMLTNQKDINQDQPSPDDLHDRGIIVAIKQITRDPNGGVRVVVEGLQRARVIAYLQRDPYFRSIVEETPDQDEHLVENEALVRAIIQHYEQFIRVSKKLPPEALAGVVTNESPGRLADTIAAYLMVKHEDKQRILGLVSVKARLEAAVEILGREMELMELDKRINIRVRKQIEKSQKEYYLREQIKAIQKELGDRDEKGTESDEFREKVLALHLPKDLQEKALREVERLEKMPPMVAEAVVVRNYIEWICSLPWSIETQDRLDISTAERILEEDHHGLDKVKERIVEYLSIRQLVSNMKGPILCFIGPPGVGKTSLAKSIARALDRKFVRISLGGVRDEAEIRGHRRTYVGALPGRIIQGMRTAGSRNPVFLMDEVDKMSSDFRGDPASALLEVLDPEQNCAFSDHYLEMPFDLSKVMFITTANTAHTIPRPLLDRMEVIYIPGYTEEEKVKIAQRFLAPKQLKEHGIRPESLEITERAIRSIIRLYTREAGVRNLEREIATVCRKNAREIVKGQTAHVRVSPSNLDRFLGIPRFRLGVAEKENAVGVAMGVAVTDVGGDVMPVEVTVMKGKGRLLLTGKLGEVMRESCQAGISYIRSRAATFGIDEQFHESYDIHIHIPEGAIPKDGPSAGITIVTAVVSALTGRPIRHDVAMSGEITLRGRVLAVGGIKEKVLAAHRAGIRHMIVPEDNRKDVEDVPQKVRKKLQWTYVEHMDQVLEVALQEEQAPPKNLPVPSMIAGHDTGASIDKQLPSH
jgi:ATP-dependent Lon protease